MPNRILREGIITSERVARLSWPAEVFYRRLMSVVDDFGRYFGRATLIRAACYPLQIGKVRDSDIAKWLTEARSAGLVRLYEVAGTPYLELADFRQQVRAKKSKFPDPVNGATHVLSECEAPAQQRPANEAHGFEDFWKAYPRKEAKGRALKAWKAAQLDEATRTAIAAAVAKQRTSTRWREEGGKYIPHPATWINDKRWLDEAQAPAERPFPI